MRLWHPEHSTGNLREGLEDQHFAAVTHLIQICCQSMSFKHAVMAVHAESAVGAVHTSLMVRHAEWCHADACTSKRCWSYGSN